MAFKKNVLIGEHYHRSLTESSVLEFNPTTLKLDTKLRQVKPEVVQRLRQRSRMIGGPNITVEAVLVHRTEVKNVDAAFKIVTNKYGFSIIPWSLSASEDLRRDAEISVFETVIPNRYLSVAQDGNNIVSVGYQEDTSDNIFFYDAKFPKLEDGICSAKLNDNTFIIFCSEETHDLVLIFRDLEDISPEEILSDFAEKRSFSI